MQNWIYSGDVNMSDYGGTFYNVKDGEYRAVEVVGLDTVEAHWPGETRPLVLVYGGDLGSEAREAARRDMGDESWAALGEDERELAAAQAAHAYGYGSDVLHQQQLKRGDGRTREVLARLRASFQL